MAEAFSTEQLADQIPYYLTAEEKKGLLKALEDWPRPIQYYINRYKDELLQGDTWRNVPVVNYSTREVKAVPAIILSNSCSVDPANERSVPPNVVVSPLLSLEKYRLMLVAAQVKAEAINQKIVAIKEQKVNNIFYLPQGGDLKTESIAVLDNLYSLPASMLTGEEVEAEKLNTLATVGFYLFLFKLSIHFCRFHEKVQRIEQA